jgi:UDP:flavonoid glycosyltransferase YjiC (YdhE family)
MAKPDPRRGWGAVEGALRRLFVAPARGQLRDYEEILEDFPADVVLNESTAGLGPMLLHDLGGPPWARLGVSPLPSLPDSAIPPLSSPELFGDSPRVAPYSDDPGVREHYRALNREAAHVHLRGVTDALNELRATLGLEPVERAGWELTISPYLQVQTGTAAFEYPRDELPPQVRYVGPLLPPAPDAFTPPPWWEEVTDADRPIVHVTQGTVATDPTGLVAPTLRALAGEKALVVVTGPGVEGPLPENARYVPMIPYPFLLPHVDVMVTNGGIGGVLAALAHSVPMVAGGRTEDKPAICARIAYTGVGIDLRSARPDPDQVGAAVRTVLEDPSYRRRAGEIRADFARHDPPEEAAALLECLAIARRPFA